LNLFSTQRGAEGPFASLAGNRVEWAKGTQQGS
jgi:hypothetical protein